MKRNGFTLVEMMAVIVLIALLSVIGVSTYRNVNESSKRKTLEAKIEEIKTAAIKWSKENNITNKTLISVNALVVEGYITAEENEIDKIAVITNPVTGENMICNTVDISFNQGEAVAIYNEGVQNCELATQSLIDTNINIKVIDENNIDKTGSGTIANWTNKNVMLVVTSTQYDSKAVSISFDFEGNTTTKNKSGLEQYTGNSYIKKDSDFNKYYNVFKIDANLLLDSKVVVTYNIAGETSKSRSYTIRIDKEEASASIESTSEWLSEDKPVNVKVDDGKGSGPKYFYVTNSVNFTDPIRFDANYKGATNADLKVGKYYIWTEDKTGNRSTKPKTIFEVNNVDKTIPECEVVFHGTEGDHGWFKEDPVTPAGRNTEPAGISGVNLGANLTEGSPEYSGFAEYDTISEGKGAERTINTPKEGTPYYCHAKSLAGIYANNNKTLFLDRTPPTINVTVSQPTTHTQSKDITVTLQDMLSGLNATTSFRYGFSYTTTQEPTNWTNFIVAAPVQTNNSVTKTVTTNDKITGTYYLWIDTSGFKDYAGNYATVAPTVNEHMFVYGPFKFDNTPPVCNGNNGKTNWTKGTYTINQNCIDNAGTTDQSLCAQTTYSKSYDNSDDVLDDNLTIYDNAGNSTVCDFNVYLDNTNPSCSLTEPGADGKNGWYKSTSVTITGSFQDNGPEHLQSKVASFGTAKTTGSTNGSTTVTFTENGASLTAYCYVRDTAGNEGSNSLTFKKDDATYAGGCTNFGGNTTWTRNAPISYGIYLATPPISGCFTDETSGFSGFSGAIWTSDCRYEANANTPGVMKQLGENGRSFVGFMSNSGVFIDCVSIHDIYLDKTPPTCNVTKSNTGKKSGVTFTVTCADTDGTSDQSGCSGVGTGTFTGVKSTTTYTVYDNAGNSGSCTGTVTSSDCDCSSCHTGSNTCEYGCYTCYS